jgi:hypothetical protein
VTEAGVGTNRYAYSANDPVNKLDPNRKLFGTFAMGISAVLSLMGAQAGTIAAAGTFFSVANAAISLD